MKPETDKDLSLNARLAIAFGGFPKEFFSEGFEDGTGAPSYDTNNFDAFALLEKAKQDGKIDAYSIWHGKQRNGKMSSEVMIWLDRAGEGKKSYNETLSKAITQALAQLIGNEKWS